MSTTSFTLENTPFPDGTTVGAYNATGYVEFPRNGPSGSPTTTATANQRSVTFAGLESGAAYYAAAEVEGRWRNIRFITAEPAEPKAWEDAMGQEVDARETADAETKAALVTEAREREFNLKRDGGCKLNGTTDDSEALQSGINKALEAGAPIYLPEGKCRTTKGIVANTASRKPAGIETAKFMMSGSGEASQIVPDASTYSCLTIGPGVAGSGSSPGGYLRDFKIAGGNEAITAAGIGKGNGTAALRLDGIRELDCTNIDIRGLHDISLDLVHNCFGSSFRNCRFGFESCRVGINVRTGTEAGEDITWTDCWVSGEVAAVFMERGRGYRFIGGQYSASRQRATNEDAAGVFILGKDYLTGAEGGDCDIELWTSFEFFRHCWAIRAYHRVFLATFGNNFNASGAGGAIGFYKNSAHAESQINLHKTKFQGTYANSKANMAVREGANSSSNWVEFGSHGPYTTSEGETNALWNPMFVASKIPRSTGTHENITRIAGAEFKVESGALKATVDEGTTWKTVKLE